VREDPVKAAAGSGDPSCVDASSLADSQPAGRGSGASVAAAEIDIDELYAQHASFLGRVLARLTGDGAHVDDLLQETFLIAFRKRDTFNGRSSHRTWLYGIAARLAMRHRRGVGRWLRALGVFSDQPMELALSPDRELDRARASAVVHDVLARMPFKQREVFVLYELEELEGADIGALLGIPVNTVWTRLHHGRKRFEEAMRKRIRREDDVA
jgi:RNA polymerase sigma-70 factor (ECF subfamily)